MLEIIWFGEVSLEMTWGRFWLIIVGRVGGAVDCGDNGGMLAAYKSADWLKFNKIRPNWSAVR